VETSVGAGVEKSVESHRPGGPERRPGLELRLLGPLTIVRDGIAVALPASRKVRALLAYLALAPHPVSRSQLCELLWDVPNDPRGELRWSLSKIRSAVDAPEHRRVDARADAIALDLSGCFVDAIEVDRAARDGIGKLAADRLRALSALYTGEFLEGLEVDRSPVFNGWLVAQRRRFRACQTALLEHLVARLPDEVAAGHLDRWLELAPFDLRVHETLLGSLVRRGRLREGEEHLAAAAKMFEAEGLDPAPLHAAWRAARIQPLPASPVVAVQAAPVAAAATPAARDEVAPRRASIAVMPFADRSATGDGPGGQVDGLASDIITRLAKLRSLFVIAQGTVFALRERKVAPEEAGRMLNVDYVVGGSLQRRDQLLTVSVELIETRTARIVWSEVFNHKADGALLVLDQIGNRIVASIDHEIETIERNRAILRPPNSLDAWEAHHRGLWHMYRFNREDNERAKHFFATAVRLDPTFARAYAGLSFTHFQNAFQGWAERGPETDRAFEAAGQSLMVDDRDPAAHWAMGRALWLRGEQGRALTELEQTVDLSPNFALGHYTLAFVHSQAGDPRAAIKASDHSRHLSPFDPLLFGMLGARAMALVRLGQFDDAADWGVKAAARPNAHAHIRAIAAYSLALAGRHTEASAYLASIRKTLPHYGIDDFLSAMRFEPEGEALFREAAKRLG
jgi:DNA-binding SARP family transcriptional activator/Flp pilus assembly protein TadD